MTESSNVYLSDTLFMFITFLLSSAILFLVNFRLSFNYNYFKNSFYADVVFLVVVASVLFLL